MGDCHSNQNRSSSFFDDQSVIPSEPHGSENRYTETANYARQMKYKKKLMIITDYKNKRKNTEEVHRLVRHRDLLITRFSGLKNNICTYASPSQSISDESALAE